MPTGGPRRARAQAASWSWLDSRTSIAGSARFSSAFATRRPRFGAASSSTSASPASTSANPECEPDLAKLRPEFGQALLRLFFGYPGIWIQGLGLRAQSFDPFGTSASFGYARQQLRVARSQAREVFRTRRLFDRHRRRLDRLFGFGVRDLLDCLHDIGLARHFVFRVLVRTRIFGRCARQPAA